MKRGSSALPWATARNRPIRVRGTRRVEHLSSRPVSPATFSATVGEPLRGQDAGRLVDQVARLATARAVSCARARAASALFGRRRRRAPGGQVSSGNRAFSCWAEVPVEPVDAEHEALGRGLEAAREVSRRARVLAGSASAAVRAPTPTAVRAARPAAMRSSAVNEGGARAPLADERRRLGSQAAVRVQRRASGRACRRIALRDRAASSPPRAVSARVIRLRPGRGYRRGK